MQFNPNIKIKNNTEQKYIDNLKHLDEIGIDYKNISNFDDFYNQMTAVKVRPKNKKCKIIEPTNICRSTLSSYLSAVSCYYKSLNDKSENIIKILNQLSNKIKTLSNETQILVKTGTLLGNQQKNFLYWRIISEVYDEIKNTRWVNKKHLKKFLVLSIYFLMPPRRLKDYYLMNITDEDKNLDSTLNYYIKSEQCFVFNNYKTFKDYGIQKIFITKELDDIIKTYINEYKIIGSLLECNRKQLYAILTGIFKKKSVSVSVDILRHSYLTEMENRGILANEANRILISKLMSHSLALQKDYIKYPDKPFVNSDDIINEYNDKIKIEENKFSMLNVNDIII